MANLTNITMSSAVNKLFLYQALAAGIDLTYQSLVPLALDEVTLLDRVVEVLLPYNPPLAEALTLETQRAILRAMGQNPTSAVGTIDDVLYPTGESGPAAVWASQNGSPTQINLTFPKSSDPAYTHYVIIVGGTFYLVGAKTGETNIDEQLPGLPGQPEVRVAYVRKGEGGAWYMSIPSPAAQY